MFYPKPDLRNAAILSILALSVGMTACSSNDDDGILGVVDTPDIDDVEVPDVEVPDVEVPDVEVPDVEVPDVEVPDVGDVDPDAPAEAGSFTITFTNTAEFQPLTPPVVALHNPPDSENLFRFFEVSQPATGLLIPIAEDGDNAPLAEAVAGQVAAGNIAGGVAVPEEGGPLLPGTSSSITVTPVNDTPVLSIVSMVVCTNDGFTGVDSMPLAAGSFTTPIYDAGSESNVEMLSYWVEPCGPDGSNISDEENGAIAIHPGQANSLDNPDFNFAPGSEFLQVDITAN